MSVGQPIRISFLPEFEGDAARFEDFCSQVEKGVGTALIQAMEDYQQIAGL